MEIAKLTFNNINLKNRDSEKLRGYILNKYIDEDLTHNHVKDKFVYRYPKIQYKVIKGVPTIIGINEGVELIKEIGVFEDEIRIEDKVYDATVKTIETKKFDIAICDEYIGATCC